MSDQQPPSQPPRRRRVVADKQNNVVVKSEYADRAFGGHDGFSRGEGGRGGRNRGRGRGRGGFHGQQGRGAEDSRVTASGPFSMGPGAAASGGAAQDVDKPVAVPMPMPMPMPMARPTSMAVPMPMPTGARIKQELRMHDNSEPANALYSSPLEPTSEGTPSSVLKSEEDEITSMMNGMAGFLHQGGQQPDPSQPTYPAPDPRVVLGSGPDAPLVLPQQQSDRPTAPASVASIFNGTYAVDCVHVLQLPSKLLPFKSAPVAKQEPTDQLESQSKPNEQEKHEDSKLSEGLVGELIVRASGRTQLRLGGMLFDVTKSIPRSFYEEVVYYDKKAQCAYAVGDLGANLVCVPDFDVLLAQREREIKSFCD